jgi:hypothetical protein
MIGRARPGDVARDPDAPSVVHLEVVVGFASVVPDGVVNVTSVDVGASSGAPAIFVPVPLFL